MAKPTAWTSNLSTPDAKKEFNQQFDNAKGVLNRLVKIVEDKKATADYRQLSAESYANPNWALMQADIVGYNRALNEILQLIKEV